MPLLRQPWRVRLNYLQQRCKRVLVLTRKLARRQLVQTHPETPDITFVRVLLIVRHFWRHVQRRADKRRPNAVAKRLCDT